MNNYNKTLARYRLLMNKYLNSSKKIEQEYGNYLARFFSDKFCDGYTSFSARRLNKVEPITFVNFVLNKDAEVE